MQKGKTTFREDTICHTLLTASPQGPSQGQSRNLLNKIAVCPPLFCPMKHLLVVRGPYFWLLFKYQRFQFITSMLQWDRSFLHRVSSMLSSAQGLSVLVPWLESWGSLSVCWHCCTVLLDWAPRKEWSGHRDEREKIVLFAQWDSCFPKGQVFVRGFGCLYCHHCSGSALLALKLALTQGQKRKRRLTTMGTPPHSLACRGYIGPKGAFLGVSASWNHSAFPVWLTLGLRLRDKGRKNRNI